ncbi:MAG TPA: cupredoxin family copper-binding protein [Candidatus Acidoferrales bacterium]|nr:cupredoxin family copper-binding protein [Candidatus Acidoferrales bacterium]
MKSQDCSIAASMETRNGRFFIQSPARGRRAAFAFVFAIFFALVATAAIHAAPGDKPVSKETRVEIKDFSFQPSEVTVSVGAKVVWVNKDEEPHTVTSTDRVFISKALDTDEEFSFTFDKPGTYEYFCSVHPRMVARVVVVGGKANRPWQ